MNNLKGLMKQKTMMLGRQATPEIGGLSMMNPPSAATPPLTGGLFKKKAVPEIKPMPSLMKRLTGK